MFRAEREAALISRGSSVQIKHIHIYDRHSCIEHYCLKLLEEPAYLSIKTKKKYKTNAANSLFAYSTMLLYCNQKGYDERERLKKKKTIVSLLGIL